MIHEISDPGAHTPRVSRKRQARLQSIVREALALVRTQGREALTLQGLAARLDCTPGALYRYFASKEALVAELQRAVVAWLRARTERCVAAAEASDVARDDGSRALLAVLVTGLAFEHFARSAPVEFGLLSMYLSEPEYRLPDREASQVFEAAWAALGDLAALLERAERAGALEPGDARERAVALWAGLQGVMQTRKLARSAGGRIDPPQVARGLLTALLCGWGAEPRTLEALRTRIAERRLAEPDDCLDDLFAAAA